MTPTNLLLVRDACATVILGMGAPAHSEHREAVWNRVRAVREVEGTLRNFLVRPLPAEEDLETAYYGDGIGMKSVVQIWTGYCGIEDDADGPMISDDMRQLYYHLSDSGTDPTVNGIVHWIPLGWTYENETPGKVWGYHAFLCSFLASDENATL
jgi:hypothetical protein